MYKSVLDATTLLLLLKDGEKSEKLAIPVHESIISTLTFTKVLSELKTLGFSPEESAVKIAMLVKAIVPYTHDNALEVVNIAGLNSIKDLEVLVAIFLALGHKIPLYTADSHLFDLNIYSVEIIKVV